MTDIAAYAAAIRTHGARQFSDAEANESAQMLIADAARFRIARYFYGEGAAREEVGAERVKLIERFHKLQAAEVKRADKAIRKARRIPQVHRKSLVAARRREEASCQFPSFSRLSA